MPIITSITAQKNQKRVNIFLNGEYSFALDLDNFGKLGLRVNQELTQEEINEIIKKGELQKSFDKTLNFTMRRPRSLKEVKDYFRRKEIDSSIQQTIIDKLVRLELLDDLKFAKWWVDLRSVNRSKRILNNELRIKGINNEVISNILEDLEIDELKIAKSLIAKKYYKWQKYEENIRRQKISQYLAGKGFGWDVISKLVSLRGDEDDVAI